MDYAELAKRLRERCDCDFRPPHGPCCDDTAAADAIEALTSLKPALPAQAVAEKDAEIARLTAIEERATTEYEALFNKYGGRVTARWGLEECLRYIVEGDD